MSEKIVINPVTRISGFLEIEVKVEEKKVVEAETRGFLFRGFEKILNGRNPFDAVFITPRICGICSTAHSLTSTLALEDALNITPPLQGKILRDLIHGSEFIQNHIRHFYQYTIPDYVDLSEIASIFQVKSADYRLPAEINKRIISNYLESLTISREGHEILSILGGKAPHNHGIFLNGATTNFTADKLMQVKARLNRVREFIDNKMLADVNTIAQYYADYFNMGKGYGNFLSYGSFNDYQEFGVSYVNPQVEIAGSKEDFNPQVITEEINYSWYQGKKKYQPFETISEDNPNKPQAYSWVKAPRYKNYPCEVGPLARQWLSGAYKGGFSCMDRTIARVLEVKDIISIMLKLVDQLRLGPSEQKQYAIMENTQGMGLVDTTRGALGHWVKIKDRLIDFYQIITPSAWNLSTKDANNLRGVAEEALIGTTINNVEAPVEIGRIIRSFDPCISCATHLLVGGKRLKEIHII